MNVEEKQIYIGLEKYRKQSFPIPILYYHNYEIYTFK